MSETTVSAQRKRILDYLRKHGSATTIDIRHKLDVLAPAPRVHELRHKDNVNIKTTWDEAVNPDGGNHKVGRYVLGEGKYSEDKK